MPETMCAPEIAVPETKTCLIEYLDLVYHYKAPGINQALGFNGGRLFFFNGTELRPISLKESIEWCASVEDANEGEGWGESPKAKWLKMIAKTL